MGMIQESASLGEPLIELNHVYKIYCLNGEEVRASDDANFTIHRGKSVAAVGKLGSGKFILMNIIGALDVPIKGDYYLDDGGINDITDKQLVGVRNRTIGFISQQYGLLPKLNILENVKLPLLYTGAGTTERKERVMAPPKWVSLEGKWRDFPNRLSDGQQQRVSIARALAGNPSLMLADEPTGVLDSRINRDVLNSLKRLNNEGNTVVMIIHNNFVAVGTKRVAWIADGRINFDGDIGDYASIVQAGSKKHMRQ